MLEAELKIKDKERKILERVQDIIGYNYQNNEEIGDYFISDPALLHLQHEDFGVTPELQESENEEEDHLVDGEGNNICLD